MNLYLWEWEHTCGLALRLLFRGRYRDFPWYVFLRTLAQLMFMLMLLAMLCVMWFLVLQHWLWLCWIWFEGGVCVGGGPWRTEVVHWVGVKATGGRSFRLSPWIGLYSSVKRRAFEHWSPEHGTIVLWAFHWGTLERWKHVHGVLVNWMSLHAVITRVSRTTSPLQLGDRFMSHLVDWFVQQPIPEESDQTLVKSVAQIWSFAPWLVNFPFGFMEHKCWISTKRVFAHLHESWTFLTPGALVVLCFYIWSRPVLHSEGHCFVHNIGTVVP